MAQTLLPPLTLSLRCQSSSSCCKGQARQFRVAKLGSTKHRQLSDRINGTRCINCASAMPTSPQNAILPPLSVPNQRAPSTLWPGSCLRFRRPFLGSSKQRPQPKKNGAGHPARKTRDRGYSKSWRASGLRRILSPKVPPTSDSHFRYRPIAAAF